MRIAMIGPPTRIWTGAPRSAAALASGLVERGHEVALAVPSSAALAELEQSPRLRIWPLRGPALVRRKPLTYAAAVPEVAWCLLRTKPDVVWSRNVLGVLAASAAFPMFIPLIWDVGIEPTPTATVDAVNRFALDRVAGVVLQSAAQRKDLFSGRLTRCPNLSARTHVLPPGVPAARRRAIDKAVAAHSSESGLLLNIASFHPRKGQLGLLKAFRQIAEHHESARLLLVGQTADSEYAGKVRDAIARDPILAERVVVRGWADDVPTLLARAHVLVSSSHDEGVPHVLREACWAGRPVIATRVGGVSTVVHDGETGLLVPPGDAAALAGALRCVLKDQALHRQLSDGALRRSRRELTDDAWLDAYEALLQRVTRQ